MTPEQIERVFGLGRLKMATGEHVEVFREAVAPGERRRRTCADANGHAGEAGMTSDRHRKRCRGPHVVMVGADERRLGER